jgi:Na+/H+-dicarboxylate symporter
MDMARTTVNVVGNCLAAAVVGRWEGELGSLGAPAQSTPALAHGAAEPVQRTGT